MARYPCPLCGGKMFIEKVHEGYEVPCPHCLKRFRVPHGAAAEAEKAAAGGAAAAAVPDDGPTVVSSREPARPFSEAETIAVPAAAHEPEPEQGADPAQEHSERETADAMPVVAGAAAAVEPAAGGEPPPLTFEAAEPAAAAMPVEPPTAGVPRRTTTSLPRTDRGDRLPSIPPPRVPGGGPTSSTTTTAFVLALIGLMCCPVTSPIAWFLAHNERVACARRGEEAPGLLTAAWVIGIVGSGILVLWGLYVVVVFGFAFAGSL